MLMKLGRGPRFRACVALVQKYLLMYVRMYVDMLEDVNAISLVLCTNQ